MKTSLGYFKIFLFLLLASLSVNIITWLVIFFQIRPNAEIIPLHYNIFYGTDLVGMGYLIYFLPAIAFFILFADYIFYRYSVRREPFSAGLVLASGFLVQLLVLTAVLYLKSIII